MGLDNLFFRPIFINLFTWVSSNLPVVWCWGSQWSQSSPGCLGGDRAPLQAELPPDETALVKSLFYLEYYFMLFYADFSRNKLWLSMETTFFSGLSWIVQANIPWFSIARQACANTFYLSYSPLPNIPLSRLSFFSFAFISILI